MPNIKQVNGVKVTGYDVAWSPLSTAEHPKRFNKCEVLLLEDGSQLFGCTFDGCDYTHTAALAIVATHWNKVHGVKPPKGWDDVANLTLGDVLELVASFNERLSEAEAKVNAAEEKKKLAQKNLAAANQDIRRLEGLLERRNMTIDSLEATGGDEVEKLKKKLTEAEDLSIEAVRVADELKQKLDTVKAAAQVLGLNLAV